MKYETYIGVTVKFKAETEKEAKAIHAKVKAAVKAVAVDGVKTVVK